MFDPTLHRSARISQRRQYKLRLDGRKSSMTQDKINLLNNINFEWDGNRKKGLNQR